MNFPITLATGALALVAMPAFAQDIPPPQEPPEQDRPVAEDRSAMFSDVQIAAFAAASRALGTMTTDPNADVETQRTQAEAVVRENGLDPAEYVAIRRAMETDPAVAVRVQQALAEMNAEPAIPPADPPEEDMPDHDPSHERMTEPETGAPQ